MTNEKEKTNTMFRAGDMANANGCTATLTPSAGDVTKENGCMTAAQIDEIAGHILALPAAIFWELDCTPHLGARRSALIDEIRRRTENGGVAIIWVRHHWVVGVFGKQMGDKRYWVVYDSAAIHHHSSTDPNNRRPTPVERDLRKFSCELGFEQPIYSA